jgi:hypothetical protein
VRAPRQLYPMPWTMRGWRLVGTMVWLLFGP